MAEQKVETNDFANIDAHLDYQAGGHRSRCGGYLSD